MRIRVRLFALARQLAGRDWLEVDLPEGASVGDLRKHLTVESPALATLLGQATFAIDSRYATEATRIESSAEVACIPPVSGG